MAHLIPMQLEDGSTIYLEASDDVSAPVPASGRVAKGVGTAQIAASFAAMEGTIRTYTSHTLSAFRNLASGNVERVTLEFGMKVGGEAGVPYVTRGTAESNLKITVECSFND